MTNPHTVYLVTGANRSIGYGLISDLLKRANSIVFAGTRNPENSTALLELQTAHENLHVIKLDSTSQEDAQNAVQEISKITDHVDVVIANAGIASSFTPAKDESIQVFREHFEVNTVGTLILFQAMLPLLNKSQNPKFVAISSAVGSITLSEQVSFTGISYGASKAALNFVTKRIHLESAGSNLVAFALNPGWVKTSMGEFAANTLGIDQPVMTVQESVDGILKVTDEATREKSGGKFLQFNGTELPW